MLVGAWVKKYLEEGEDALEPRNGNPYAALHRSKSLTEVERLRLLAAKQEVELARLKKGYWVEGAGANREYVTGSGKTTKFSKNSKYKVSGRFSVQNYGNQSFRLLQVEGASRQA